MDAEIRAFVRARAGNRCEYCLLRQESMETPHHIEHIVAKQHGGDDRVENLALACARCNAFKGPNLSGFDGESGQIVPLFNPRRHEWAEHFELQGFRVIGLSAVGRVTVHVLGFNETRRLELRALLLANEEFP